MLLAKHTPGGLPVVWRAAHCPTWRNTPCTSTKGPILWWYPRQHDHKSSFPEIHSGECSDEIGFYQLRYHTLCLVTADIKGPVLRGSISSAAPCLGRADPSQQQIPPLSRGDGSDGSPGFYRLQATSSSIKMSFLCQDNNGYFLFLLDVLS